VAYDLWYKNAVIYCLDVGRFRDGNGDGTGDFIGLTEKLDYLVGLGVTTLWLMPFFPSPNRDDGYDVTDFYAVDPRHGTLGDFVEFMHCARGRGLHVILDLVANHTSNEHPWFQAARRGIEPYRDYYYWSEHEPEHAREGMVFPGKQETTWTYDEEARAFYYHRFHDFQPDLRTENPAVLHEIRKIMGSWLELGVSGFRVDAVPFLIESADRPASRQLRFDFLRQLREFLQWRTGHAVLLAEANVLPEESIDYFGKDGERMHMLFNFPVNQRLFYAFACGDTRPLRQALHATSERPEHAQYATFLRNHDELDLGRLSEDERARVFAALGPDPDVQLYDRGLRRRLAPLLSGDRRRLELALAVLFGFPGTPVIYYGDELGMGDDLAQPERLSVRTAMQWSADAHAGFTSADRSSVPVIQGGPFGYETVNAADQRRERESLLNVTERMIRTRKQCPELAWGSFDVLETGCDEVLAIVSSWQQCSVLSVFNFSAEERRIDVALREHHVELQSLLDARDETLSPEGSLTLHLEPFGYRWYRARRRESCAAGRS
jgi:maltose alpha-D-glucosyltransferase/alpha-amylase